MFSRRPHSLGSALAEVSKQLLRGELQLMADAMWLSIAQKQYARKHLQLKRLNGRFPKENLADGLAQLFLSNDPNVPVDPFNFQRKQLIANGAMEPPMEFDRALLRLCRADILKKQEHFVRLRKQMVEIKAGGESDMERFRGHFKAVYKDMHCGGYYDNKLTLPRDVIDTLIRAQLFIGQMAKLDQVKLTAAQEQWLKKCVRQGLDKAGPKP